MKLCKDCKYYVEGAFLEEISSSICARPKSHKGTPININPVSGKQMNAVIFPPALLSCLDQRLTGECGSEGKFWEEK